MFNDELPVLSVWYYCLLYMCIFPFRAATAHARAGCKEEMKLFS